MFEKFESFRNRVLGTHREGVVDQNELVDNVERRQANYHLTGRLVSGVMGETYVGDFGVGDAVGLPVLGSMPEFSRGHIISIDNNPAKISEAHKNSKICRLEKKGKLRFIKGDLRGLPLPSDIFDAVVAVGLFDGGLEGGRTAAAAILKEAHRTLKPGGHLVITAEGIRAEKLRRALDWFQADRKRYVTSSEIDTDAKKLFRRRDWYVYESPLDQIVGEEVFRRFKPAPSFGDHPVHVTGVFIK